MIKLVKTLLIILVTINLQANNCEYCNNLVKIHGAVELKLNGHLRKHFIEYIYGNCDTQTLNVLKSLDPETTLTSNLGQHIIRAELNPSLEKYICNAICKNSTFIKKLSPNERHLLIKIKYVEFISQIPKYFPETQTIITLNDGNEYWQYGLIGLGILTAIITKKKFFK